MAPKLKDLCRLCAKKHEFLKDLLDKNHKSIVDMIRQFTQITVIECENMPTKICLDCEEKLVSFQLFILECYRTQDRLRQICIEEPAFGVKKEIENQETLVAAVKEEVKDELTAADLMYEINTEMHICEIEATELARHMASDSNTGFDDAPDIDDDDDDPDNITIASLKEEKMKITEENMAKLNEVIAKKHCKNRDFLKLVCSICTIKFKTWKALGYHYYNEHKCKPLAYCLCGFPVRSLFILNRHIIQEHKADQPEQPKPTVKKVKIKNESTTIRPENQLKVKDFVDFQCQFPTCNKIFSSWYKLSGHTQSAHKTAPVVKCSCGVILKSKSCLYKHVTDHKTPSSWSCDQCALVTKSEEALKKHKLRHIPKSDRRFQCSNCDSIFRSKDALRSHQKKHIPVEQRQIFQCDYCELKFTTRASAATHMRVIHEKVKSYVCDLCGYACGTSGELRQHRAIHSDDKPYVCNKCSKPFKTYSNLKTHMDTHEDTSYACYVCNRVLNSRRTLRKHLLVHDDKCRHICDYCNKAFKRRQTLKVHMYTHTGDKPLTCKWCGDRFAYASTLRSHRLRCHSDKMAAASYSYTHLEEQPQEYIKNNGMSMPQEKGVVVEEDAM